MPQPIIEADVAERLEDHRDQILGIRAQVDQHADHANQARALARSLTEAVQPLRSLFDGIRFLHTTATWQGNAATDSRMRLDGHEARTNQAVRQIDALVDELEERALQLENQQIAGLGEIEDLRWQMYALENQLTRSS